MNATVKKSGSYGSASNAGAKKSTGNKYKTDIRTAYDIGYTTGWDGAYDIPKRIGAQTAAAYGYKKGMRNRRRTDQYTKQYQRYGKKN